MFFSSNESGVNREQAYSKQAELSFGVGSAGTLLMNRLRWRSKRRDRCRGLSFKGFGKTFGNSGFIVGR